MVRAIEGPNAREQIVFSAFHSFLVEVQAKLATYLASMRNSNLENTVNSLYSGHCRDLKLVSSVARVRNRGSLFPSNVCNLFLPEFICCPYYRGVRYSGVSARRELTV